MDASPDFVKDVSTEDFAQEVLQRSREVPVVVDFWAAWCAPCRVLGPALEKVTDEYGGAFELVKVDVDANQQLAAQYRVQGIPTVAAFKDGQEVDRFSGALGEAAIRDWVQRIVPSELDLMVDQARTARLDDDDVGAEHIFRQVLEQKPDHNEAGASLASMLIDRGDTDDALVVLGRLTSDPDVERLQAAARLKAASGFDVSEIEARMQADPSDEGARLALARALAGRAEYEPALDHLLAVVRARGGRRDEARLAMLDIFEVLGDEHPLTATYRRQLGSALF
jgi:putative thioredoxin